MAIPASGINNTERVLDRVFLPNTGVDRNAMPSWPVALECRHFETRPGDISQ